MTGPVPPSAGANPFEPLPDVTLAAAPHELARHNGRVLPADTGSGQRWTVYVGDHLLVRDARPGSPAFDALQEAARQHGLTLQVDATDEAMHRFAQRQSIEHYP